MSSLTSSSLELEEVKEQIIIIFKLSELLCIDSNTNALYILHLEVKSSLGTWVKFCSKKIKKFSATLSSGVNTL